MLVGLERTLLTASHPLAARLALLHPEVVEIGASGKRFDFAALQSWLENDELSVMEFSDEDAWEIRDGVVHLTYNFVRQYPGQDAKRSARSSIWIRDNSGRWKLRFHQGTPTA